MKSLERIVLKHVLSEVQHNIDPLQFGLSGDDALLHMLHNIYRHLDGPNDMLAGSFEDFSSAFSTIRPHLMMDRRLLLGLNANIVRWVESFLTDRIQYVRVNEVVSLPI